MTAIQEQAIEMVKRIPEDKTYILVNILENIEKLLSTDSSADNTESMEAYQNLQKYRKPGTEERDYKAELYEALEEKYAGIH